MRPYRATRPLARPIHERAGEARSQNRQVHWHEGNQKDERELNSTAGKQRRGRERLLENTREWRDLQSPLSAFLTPQRLQRRCGVSKRRRERNGGCAIVFGRRGGSQVPQRPQFHVRVVCRHGWRSSGPLLHLGDGRDILELRLILGLWLLTGAARMPLARAPDILFAPKDHHDHLGPPFLHCGTNLYHIGCHLRHTRALRRWRTRIGGSRLYHLLMLWDNSALHVWRDVPFARLQLGLTGK